MFSILVQINTRLLNYVLLNAQTSHITEDDWINSEERLKNT